MNLNRNIFVAAAVAAVALFASAPTASAQSTRSPGEIDQIVGPIALYPDPLVSIVLPASTLPNDVQQAAQVVASGDIAAVDNQPWDDSVRAVAHYPDLVEWMSDNIDWTAQLGATFATQPNDVLDSIQRLRARARAVGTLVDTPQQRVVVEGDLIAIVPAEPSRIYVPYYDPAVVYVSNPRVRGAAAFRFSAGFALGAWMTYDFDWRRHSLFVVDRAEVAHRDWTRPSFAINIGTAATDHRREWRASPNRAQINVNVSRTIVTPRAIGDRTAGANERRPAASPNTAITSTEQQQRYQQQQTDQRTQAQREEQARQARTAPAANQNELSLRERERAQETNRNQSVFTQNQNQPARQNPPPNAAPQAQPPANRAMAVTEQQRVEQQRAEQQREQEQRDRQAPEARRPAPRGSVTAGSSGEYPRPPAANENKAPEQNAQGEQERERRMEFPRRDEQHPQSQVANPPQAQPQPSRAQTPPAIVKNPASTNPNPPNAQAKPETDEEKAKRLQQEEEEKKKKKPDGTDGT